MLKNICFLWAVLLLAAPCFAADAGTTLAPVNNQNIRELTQDELAKLIKANQGKVVMINFFATWCPPCKVEIPELIKLRQAYPEDKLLLLGLSVDEEKSPVPEFLERTGVNYPVFMAGKDITNVYQISSVPHNAFFSPAGKLILSEPGLADMEICQTIVNGLLAEDNNAAPGK